MADLKDLAEQYGLEDYEQLLGGYPNAEKFITGLKDAAVRAVPTTEQMRDPNFIIDTAGLGGAIKAYHGSPHLFDRFDMSKLGTGEGAQSYGHGLYFAQDPSIAEIYRKNLAEKHESPKSAIYETSIQWPNAEREAMDPLGEHHLLDWYQPAEGYVQEAIPKKIKELRNSRDAIDSKYTDGDFNPDDLFANIFSFPSREDKTAIDRIAEEINMHKYMSNAFEKGAEGSVIYNKLIKMLGSPEKASEYLHSIDIPGIKYLDATSRRTDKGTRNFVTFGDEYPQIVKRAGSLDELKEKNLNKRLIEKYLSEGKLSPDGMAQYEQNALAMETPLLQRYNVENAEMQIPDTKKRAKSIGFMTQPSKEQYHLTRNDWENNIPDLVKSDLGFHTGSIDQANYRGNVFDKNAVGQSIIPIAPNKYTNYLKLKDLGSFHADSIAPHLENKKMLAKGEAKQIQNAIDDDWKLKLTAQYDQQMRDVLSQHDIDAIKYANEHEGQGLSYAHINPSMIRSRFAAFDPLRKNSSSIMASGLLGGLGLKYANDDDQGYAEGGIVKAQDQNENLGRLAEMLGSARDIGNEYKVPSWVPLAGGAGAGDLLMGRTPEEIENWSYGNAPMQIPEMSNVPQFKRGRAQSLADALTTLAPGVKATEGLPAGLSFIGPKSRNWDKVAAELAAKKLDEGADPAEVWREHLIGRMPDKTLFSEISDKEAQAIPKDKWSWGNTEDLRQGESRITDPVSSFLSHPELHNAYHGMVDFGDNNRRLLMNVSPERKDGFFGDNIIGVGMVDDAIDKSTAMHELQHAIQDREGWSQGGDLDSAASFYIENYLSPKLKELNNSINEGTKLRGNITNEDEYAANVLRHKQLVAEREKLNDEVSNIENNKGLKFRLYKRLAGEAQARATQDRLDMDMAQRRENYPLAGGKLSDIPLEELIYKYEGNGPSLSSKYNEMHPDKNYLTWDLTSDSHFDEEGYEMPGDPYVLIEKVYTHPDDRNKGVATRLMSDAMKEIESKHPNMPIKLSPIPLDKDTDIERLADFYKKFGFDEMPEGHMQKYAEGGAVDSAISDYKQLLSGYPNATKFVNALQSGIESHIPTTEDLQSPERMGEWSLAAALNQPTGLATKPIKNLNQALLDKYIERGYLPEDELAKYEKNAAKMRNVGRQDINVQNAQANPEYEAYKAEYDVPFMHGTERLDRVLSKEGLDPKRATSGPMLYGTDSPEIASSYAKNKQDTSMMDDEDWDYSKAFTVAPQQLGHRGTIPYTVEQSWNYLDPEVKRDILTKAPRVGYSDLDQWQGDFVLHPEGEGNAINQSHYDYLLKQSRGNPIKAMRDYWLDSGNLFNEEEKMSQLYRLAGYPHEISQEMAPWTKSEGVLTGVSRIRNPLDTSNVDELREKVIPALKDAFKNDRSRKKDYGADSWDKNTRYTPKEWVNELENDLNKGENSYVWTSIPDKITSELKRLGYNGIYDTGGKSAGADSHQVTIPFNPSQIRSKFAAFDPILKHSPNLLAGTALGSVLLHDEDQGYAQGGSVDKDSLQLNKPQRTPNHPTKSHIVKTMVDGKEKIIRFGEQGAETAGKPKEGESDRMTAKRESFKARHAKNIAKGPSSAAYWADKVKWAEGGEVDIRDDEGYADDLARLKRAYENSNFGPNDSMIASTIRHPAEAAKRAKDSLMRSIDTAGGVPREILDESSAFPVGIAPSRDEQAQAALDLASLAQTGAMPFAPESAGGVLGSILRPNSQLGTIGSKREKKPITELEEGVKIGKRISTATPTDIAAKKMNYHSTPEHIITLDTMRSNPEAFEKNMRLMSEYMPFNETDTNKQADLYSKYISNNLKYFVKNAPEDFTQRSGNWYKGANALANDISNAYNIPIEASAGVLARLSPQQNWLHNVEQADRVVDIFTNHQNTVMPVGKYKGTKLKDLPDSLSQSEWIKDFDQHTTRNEYYGITPEGALSDEIIRTKTGEPSTFVWQSFPNLSRAVDILKDPSIENVSKSLGLGGHKIRNFYNNMADPFHPEDVTIDTHAGAAALFTPYSSSAIPIGHLFGGGAKKGIVEGSSKSGMAHGLYGLYADAYRGVAKDLNLPAQSLQSQIWELARETFPTMGKEKMQKQIQTNVLDELKKGKITEEEARDKILDIATKGKGFLLPDWYTQDYAKGGEVKDLHSKYEESDYGYGNRPDKTKKGLGYFGELERPDGTGVMTEYSIGVPIHGEEMDVPTLIPTLTPDEIRLILHMQDGEDMPRSIVHKAIDHAHQRLSEGKPIFATDEDLYAHGGIVDVLHNDAIEQIMKAFMESMTDEEEPSAPAVSIQITTQSQPLKSGKIPTSIREAKHG